MPSIASIVSWVLIGLVGGSLAGLITTWDRKGLGWVRNLGVGLAGAIVGACCSACSDFGPNSTRSLSRSETS
jgi:uncharacterized membrane protein YeaQ/YmgE (transglycosylase-associated protein family)